MLGPVVVRFGLIVAAVFLAGFAAYSSYTNENAHQQEENHRARRPRESTPPEAPQPTGPRRRRKSRSGRQKDILTDELNRGTFECTICMYVVGSNEPTYACPKCRHFFHLKCSQTWAQQNRDTTFNCALCYSAQPVGATSVYKCMCGRTTDPPSLPGLTPHCCQLNCPKCGQPCHPGHCD